MLGHAALLVTRWRWDIDDWLGLDDGDKELWLDVARQLRAQGWKR
ncbi:hypothetical protein PP508_gp73 [Gordonia phage Samman98]|uniref:Uncharacterized protein n=1 Tax=Gordonia phage Samman98 TaxID=2862998 RepID=A0AC61NDT9_9CAUD|nr:hypothetical protein PP508_gp73 [Gordonia phage Samman98]QYC54551.1 hypothetical protein SEA_SAMMAN98_73 [Gordonia phage Samman98]